jgi:hypothetical protein
MLSLVFFSTFEPICLTLDSCLQRKGVPMLYERAAKEVPTLYVCPVENVLGRVALISCYLNGNTANTIPHKYRSRIPRKDTARAVEDLAEREPPSSQVVWGPPTYRLRRHRPVRGRSARLVRGLHAAGPDLGDTHGLCLATPQHIPPLMNAIGAARKGL